MDTTPEIKFFESVREFCALARRKARDPQEGLAATQLEIEIGKRIKKLTDVATRAQTASEVLSGVGGGR